MVRHFILLVMFFATVQVYCETIDSLRVECVITDSESGKPVSAEVRYESLPYGSIIGFRRGAEFYFVIRNEEEYSILVKADGYIPAKVKIAYRDYAGSGKIIEEIKLQPSRPGKVMRLESLNFGQASADITTEMYQELDGLADMLKTAPSMKIRLEGHTDYQGDPKLNMRLSEDRVKAVREYLVSKGIERERISIKAFGGTQPLSTSNSAEAHAMNRRVEVRITEN